MIYQKFLILFLLLTYFIILCIGKEGICMKLKICNMYCNYVIKTLEKVVKSLNVSDKNYNVLDDALYKSYLKLEKILEDKY